MKFFLIARLWSQTRREVWFAIILSCGKQIGYRIKTDGGIC